MKHVKLYESFLNEYIEDEDAAFAAFLKDEQADNEDAYSVLVTIEEAFEIEGKSTNSTWEDGVPVTKKFDRGREELITIEAGEYNLIVTEGRSSGDPMIYWLKDKVWYTAIAEYAMDFLALNTK